MFKPGESGNPNGRPKGAADKTTKELRDSIKLFLENNVPSLQDKYEQLEPKEQVNLISTLLKFAIPTLKAVEGSFGLNDLELEKLRVNSMFPDLKEEKKGVEVFDFSKLTGEEVRQYKAITQKAVSVQYNDNKQIESL